MSHQQFDQTKSDAFIERIARMLNDASIALMISIGHQTGLFDTMAGLTLSTSEQIASAAGLNERYVREWLGAMMTGRIVEYTPADQTYSLPPEHSAWLTKDTGFNNMAPSFLFIPLLAEVEQQIIDCFQNGGGVPYTAYTRFQQVMAANSRVGHDARLLSTTLPLVPGLVEQLQAGIKVADIGCGSGYALNLMAQNFPNSQFVGYDFSDDGIAAGTAQAKALGLSNVHFEVRDVANLDESETFDFVTAFDAIHDQAQPAQVLQGIYELLRPESKFLMVDIAASSNVEENLDHVAGPFLYTISCLHCMTVSLAYDGAGLGAAWGEQKAQQMLAEAGFSKIALKRVESDVFNAYYIAEKR